MRYEKKGERKLEGRHDHLSLEMHMMMMMVVVVLVVKSVIASKLSTA